MDKNLLIIEKIVIFVVLLTFSVLFLKVMFF